MSHYSLFASSGRTKPIHQRPKLMMSTLSTLHVRVNFGELNCQVWGSFDCSVNSRAFRQKWWTADQNVKLGGFEESCGAKVESHRKVKLCRKDEQKSHTKWSLTEKSHTIRGVPQIQNSEVVKGLPKVENRKWLENSQVVVEFTSGGRTQKWWEK